MTNAKCNSYKYKDRNCFEIFRVFHLVVGWWVGGWWVGEGPVSGSSVCGRWVGGGPVVVGCRWVSLTLVGGSVVGDFVICRLPVTVCNFQSMKSPVKLNSLLLKLFCYITWLLYHLIRRDTGRLTNEAFTSNSFISSKQLLSGLKITNW